MSRWTSWLLKNIFFLLMAFWKFQHFNLVSKISQKLFKPLPCHKFQYLTVLEKCCIPSAYLQWLFHSSERVVTHGPLLTSSVSSLSFLFLFISCPSLSSPLPSPFLWEMTQNDPQGLKCVKPQHTQKKNNVSTIIVIRLQSVYFYPLTYICKSICCGYSFELPGQFKAIQITHNIMFYTENQKQILHKHH